MYIKMRFIFLPLIFLNCFVFSDDNRLSNAIHSVWKGIKKFNIDDYDIPLVHRPFSEMPGDAVSEGIGYGMIVSVMLDDQEYFDKIWSAGERYMWNGRWYDWRVDEYGNRVAYGAATDAEQDIAFSLLQASRKVENGLWKSNTTITPYKERGVQIIRNMWDYHMIDPESFDVAPGAGWGGKDFVNIGYFAPAWYRLFSEYDDSHDWQKVIDRGYDVISKSPGYLYGLVPDWMTPDGNFISNEGLGYNAYGNGEFLYKDAIRVFWRIGTDLLWNAEESRAKDFLTNSFKFITSKTTSDRLNFYDMNGELVPETDVWVFNNGLSHRSRREYSALTVGMWSIVPKVVSKENPDMFLENLLEFHKNDTQLFWGNTTDYFDRHTGQFHPKNELYFEQFLGLFGAFILNDTFYAI